MSTPTEVWMIEVYHGEGRDGYWETDPDYGVFGTLEAAEGACEALEAPRRAAWLAQPTEDSWWFKQRLDSWKVANFGKPESEWSTPRPVNKPRKIEDYSCGYKIQQYEVKR